MLILAMIIIFAMASMVIILGRSMRVEARASGNRAAKIEADAIARGAEQYILALLADRLNPVEDLDEQAFAAVPLGKGHFWIIRPMWGDPTLPQYGLLDESSKLNLNTASFETLRLLPGMDDTIAGAIVDWRDEDDETSPSGAESNVYLGRDPPYQAKNAPFETVEELLLVNGMTPELLYGPPSADISGDDAGSFLGSEYYLSHGLYDFFTAHGRDAQLDPDGQPRINASNEQSRSDLRTAIQQHIGEDAASRLQERNYTGLFDLAQRLQLTSQELEKIEPYLAFGTTGARRVNVNTAPREVLESIEFLDVSQVNALLARRASAVIDNPTSASWVLDVLDGSVLSDVGQYLTGRGGVYSADIVAMSGDGRGITRVRLIVDNNASPPRIVYRRDITDRGLPIDREILAEMRTEFIR